MSLFLKKQKVFISHKRINGTASPEAVLLKQLLDENCFLENFLDIHEDTLGEFPSSLRKKINSSDSFIFLIPTDGDISFLDNLEGWFYKEIDCSTYRYLIASGNSDMLPFQILPVTFSNSFDWPEELPQGISVIKSFDICRLNLNDKPEEIQTKLAKALNIQTRRRIYWWKVVTFISLLLLTIVLGVKIIKHIIVDRVNEKRVEFIKSSFDGRIATGIQPAIVVSTDEYTSLDSTIYEFFALRDKFHIKVRTLPAVSPSIIRLDDFSLYVINDAYSARTEIFEYSVELQTYTQLIANNFPIPSTSDTSMIIKLLNYNSDFQTISDVMSELNHKTGYNLDLLKRAKNRYDESSSKAIEYVYSEKKEKAMKYYARCFDDYLFWFFMDQSAELYEETARLCNMYLTGPWRYMLLEK